MGRWVGRGLKPILAQEGPPLLPLGEEPIEVEDSAKLAQKEGTTEEDDAAIE